MASSFIFGKHVLPIAYVAVFSAILLIDARRRFAERERRDGFPVAVFLLATCAYVVTCRFPIVWYDLALNPDEALMAANAMHARYGWLDWRVMDSVTSGPLNSLVLAWPYLLGGDVTLASGRVTGWACFVGFVTCLFFAIRSLSDIRTAIIATFPAVIFYGATIDADFIHYSSEHLPIFLLGLALLLFVLSFAADRLGYLLACAIVLGLVPFSKLQAAPIAALIGAFVVARAASTGASPRAAVTRVAAVIAAALCGPLIYLLPLALSGGLDDAFKSYIVQPRLRTGSGWSDQVPWMVQRTYLFRAIVIAYAITAAVALGCFIVGRRRAGTEARHTPSLRWSIALAPALFAVTYIAISFTGRSFTHYLLLSLPVLVLTAGVALASIARSRLSRRWRDACQFAVLAAVCGIVLPATSPEWGWRWWYSRDDGALLQGKLLQASHNLAWLRPKTTDSLLCWGWQPNCYVDAAIRPATRDATNENQIYNLSLAAYFRARFIGDFQKRHPDFVVDTVAPGSFTFERAHENGASTFPPLWDIISNDFSLVSRVEPPERCPRLYVRKSRLAALNESLIAFSDLAASAALPGHGAAALDDRSVVETCDDNWLLPEGTLGSATARFAQASRVKTVAILNTRRGRGDRRAGAGRVRLSLQRGGETVWRQELSLRPFPYWTFQKLDVADADALTIEILSFQGSGGGLNEIKAYRD